MRSRNAITRCTTKPSSRSCRYTASYFTERHSRLMNTLSTHGPRPSIEQRIPTVSSNPVNAILLMDNRHASTRRLAQSMIATRYRNQPCTGPAPGENHARTAYRPPPLLPVTQAAPHGSRSRHPVRGSSSFPMHACESPARLRTGEMELNDYPTIACVIKFAVMPRRIVAKALMIHLLISVPFLYSSFCRPIPSQNLGNAFFHSLSPKCRKRR